MPFPDVNSEFETLLEPTRIWLFGKPFKSIAYVPEEMWGMDPNDPEAQTDDEPKEGQSVPSEDRETLRDRGTWMKRDRDEANRRENEKEKRKEVRKELASQKAAAQKKLSEDPRVQSLQAKLPAGAMPEEPENPPPTYRANEFKNYVAPGQAKRDEHGRDPQLPMPPRRIERKLRQENQQFVRIYSFSFEGHYYRLPRPLLFLLSGRGQRPDEDRKALGMFERHVAFSTKTSGTASRDWQFGDDIRVWAVDRKDLAVCLDVEVANYHELLLNSMVAGRGSASRGDMVSRGDVVGRGDGGTASRSAGAGAFRGDMIGPHQNW